MKTKEQLWEEFLLENGGGTITGPKGNEKLYKEFLEAFRNREGRFNNEDK